LYRRDNIATCGTRFAPLTDDGAVAEEQLMELRGEAGEETTERCD